MGRKHLLYLVITLMAFCCCNLSFAQTLTKVDDKAIWMYHPDKDQYIGAYEWWYADAQLENGCLLAIVFGVPNIFLDAYNHYLTDVSKGYPVPTYDPKNFTTVDFTITDATGKILFSGHEDVKPKDIIMPTEKKMVVKFNNCSIERNNEKLPTFLFKMNIKDREGKNFTEAKLVFDSLVPAVMAGRGHILNAEVDGKHFIHEWQPFAATAKVNADIKITNKDTGKVTKIKEKGFGYHDKNYGNHACRVSMKGWIWTKVAEPDLTILYIEVPTIFAYAYPTNKPCIIIYKGNVVAATETYDIAKGPPGNFRLPYPTETTLTFKPESGITGTMKYYDMKLAAYHEGSAYSRWICSYSLDIESQKYGKIKRIGKAWFEYTDFTVK